MDAILQSFLEAQRVEAEALAAASDILTLACLEPQVWLAAFACRGVVRAADGSIGATDRFVVGYRFGDEFLRGVVPAQVVHLLEPANAFHPNVRAPAVCLGPIAPGTPFVELLYRTYDLLTYRNFTPREDDSFDAAACAWARRNPERFPTDPRPLKRRVMVSAAQQVTP